MARKKIPKTSRTGKRGGSVDEAAAFAFYCEARSDGRLNSIADVAKKYGVSRQSMGVICKRNNWTAKRREIGNEAVLHIAKTLGEIVKEKNETHLKQFEEMAEMGREIMQGQIALYREMIASGQYPKRGTPSFSPFAASVAASMWKDGINGQRVAVGLPTDVTKSLAMNLNFNDELPREELEKMQQFLDANFNKNQLTDGNHPKQTN